MQPNAKKQPMSRDCIICLAAGLVGYILLRLPVGIYGIGISLGVGVMYVAAYLLPIPAAVFCTVLPAVLADVIWGNFLLLPMTAVVTAVCQVVLCRMFVQYVQNNLGRFLLAAGVGAVFYLIGTFFYFAIAYGVLSAMIAAVPFAVQWIVASIVGYWGIAIYRSKLLPKLR